MIWKNASFILLWKYISVCTEWNGVLKVNINKENCELNIKYIKQNTKYTWLNSQIAIFHSILLLKIQIANPLDLKEAQMVVKILNS